MRSRARRFVFVCIGWIVLVAPLHGARADQRRDWIVAAREPGTYVNFDLVFPGMQIALEHRHAIYGRANELVARVSSLITLPFLETQIDTDLRLLVLTLGVSAGVHDDFRLHAFGPSEAYDRQTRRDRESAGRIEHDRWGYAEGRLTLSLPLNQHVVFQNVNTLRIEARPARSFDWRNGVVHDGRLFRSDVQLFFKHRDWGGVAPMFQWLSFDVAGRPIHQLNYGLACVTRVGLTPRDDLFYFQWLYHFGGRLGGDDNQLSYGAHAFFGSFTFIAAYRTVIDLGH